MTGTHPALLDPDRSCGEGARLKALYVGQSGSGRQVAHGVGPTLAAPPDRLPERLLAWLEGRSETLPPFTLRDVVRDVLPRGFPVGLTHVASDGSWGARQFMLAAFAVEVCRGNAMLVVGGALRRRDREGEVTDVTTSPIRTCEDFDGVRRIVRESLTAGTRVIVVDDADVLLDREENEHPEAELRSLLREIAPLVRQERASVAVVTRLVYSRGGWQHPMRARYGGTLRSDAGLRVCVTGNPLQDILDQHASGRLLDAQSAGEWVAAQAIDARRNTVLRRSECVVTYDLSNGEELQ